LTEAVVASFSSLARAVAELYGCDNVSRSDLGRRRGGHRAAWRTVRRR